MINKKIAFILLSSLLLGGCTLTDSFRTGGAAKDVKPEQKTVTASQTPSPADPELSSMPTTSSSSDVTSLETDINNTTILEEDFSDLE